MLPTLIVAFNRPHLLERQLSVLARFRPEPLFVALDGPRPGRPEERAKVERCAQAVVHMVDWTDRVFVRRQPENVGLRRNVSSAISWALSQVERVVVLEDDCLPGETFFRFCAEMLERYADEPRIGVVSGTSFCPPEMFRPEASYYFSIINHCWGWATWRRAWQCYDDEMRAWPALRESEAFARLLPGSRARRHWARRFDAVKRGKIESWAYRWTLSCWANGLLTVQPFGNLVSNVGFEDEGSHLQWKNDPLAKRAVRELQFPLRAPSELAPARAIDAWVQSNIFQPSLSVKLMRAWHRNRALLKSRRSP